MTKQTRATAVVAVAAAAASAAPPRHRRETQHEHGQHDSPRRSVFPIFAPLYASHRLARSPRRQPSACTTARTGHTRDNGKGCNTDAQDTRREQRASGTTNSHSNPCGHTHTHTQSRPTGNSITLSSKGCSSNAGDDLAATRCWHQREHCGLVCLSACVAPPSSLRRHRSLSCGPSRLRANVETTSAIEPNSRHER